jgi:hypothetical protein
MTNKKEEKRYTLDELYALAPTLPPKPVPIPTKPIEPKPPMPPSSQESISYESLHLAELYSALPGPPSSNPLRISDREILNKFFDDCIAKLKEYKETIDPECLTYMWFDRNNLRIRSIDEAVFMFGRTPDGNICLDTSPIGDDTYPYIGYSVIYDTPAYTKSFMESTYKNALKAYEKDLAKYNKELEKYEANKAEYDKYVQQLELYNAYKTLSKLIKR